jgi:hypothetical protein
MQDWPDHRWLCQRLASNRRKNARMQDVIRRTPTSEKSVMEMGYTAGMLSARKTEEALGKFITLSQPSS